MTRYLLQAASTLFIFGFFAAVVLFLRFLFGPRGRFREAHWDVLNARAAREASVEKHRQAFTAYAKRFFRNSSEAERPLRLKLDHSAQVFLHALTLVEEEPALADAVLSRAVLLGALYHDVGRFEQYTRWKTFADPLSCDHGLLGAKILRKEGFLKEEPDAIRRMVLFVVGGHNRFHLPLGAPPAYRDALAAVRDADKLDIMRIMKDHLAEDAQGDSVVLLHLEDRPDAFSPAVLSALREGRAAKYCDMLFHNDFRLLLCSWLYDFNYDASLRRLRVEGYLEAVVGGLKGIPGVQQEARAVIADVYARRLRP